MSSGPREFTTRLQDMCICEHTRVVHANFSGVCVATSVEDGRHCSLFRQVFFTRPVKVRAQQFLVEVKPWPRGVVQNCVGRFYLARKPWPQINSGDWIIEGRDEPMSDEEFRGWVE